MKVAIVGLAPTSRHLAPWNDPEWELWGLPWDVEHWPEFSRTFEMHQNYSQDESYLERLKDCRGLHMQEAYLPNAKPYPLEEVAKTTGGNWGCSISYMLALAIHEGAQEIGLWGVDAADEYRYQRENIVYLIGLARGKGITVHIPDSSPLCKFESDPDYPYVGRYGWLG